eukprot:Sro755_g197590.1 Mucin 4, cell surface associated (345) ;mRNA; f:10614-11648
MIPSSSPSSTPTNVPTKPGDTPKPPSAPIPAPPNRSFSTPSPTSSPTSFPSWSPSSGPTSVPTKPGDTPKPTRAPIPNRSFPTPLPPPPGQLKPKCTDNFGTIWGDVHVITFDGLKYDCQGEGEFQILTSLNEGSDFEIQGRFSRFHATRRITITRGIVINTGVSGTPTVQLDLPAHYDHKCDVDMYVDKMYRHIREGTGFNTVNVTREAWNTYSVVYPWTGINLEIQVQKSSKFGCFFNIKICIPDEIRKSESLVGLLGSPNANRFDNWMKSDGTVLPFPSTKKTSRFQTAYDYCVDNWCIYHEEESLFTYNKSQEESFDFFYNCGDKYKKDIQSCVEKPPKN